ncbi:sprT domain-containing protein [Burkholderia cepacia]|uniref:sprT domain-containing protein n=1 Tax=Burkholderia cepacia TaxID=292 RepID=UPI002AB7CAF7|nr:sprT domain-containing protein [Burkholderia cepacia]
MSTANPGRLALKPKEREALLAWANGTAAPNGEVNLLDWPGWQALEVAAPRTPTEQTYAELQYVFDFYNTHLFESALPQCIVTLQRRKSTLGYYSRGRFVSKDGKTLIDELAMNPEYFATMPLLDILQTVVHEQVHQWQDHFGTPSRPCYHNMEFAEKMESLGLMPSDTGYPGGKRTGQKMDDYMIVGGHFEQVTRVLLKSGFGLSWFDRFPVPVTTKRYSELIPAHIESSVVDLPAQIAESGDSGDVLASGAVDPPYDVSGATAVTVVGASGLAIASSEEPAVAATGTENMDLLALACSKPLELPACKPQRSGGVRHRFVCPTGCAGQSAYGRLTLRIRCDHCDALMTSESNDVDMVNANSDEE